MQPTSGRLTRQPHEKAGTERSAPAGVTTNNPQFVTLPRAVLSSSAGLPNPGRSPCIASSFLPLSTAAATAKAASGSIRASAIFRWLHVAKRRARGRAVTVAIQLSDNTSARVFARQRRVGHLAKHSANVWCDRPLPRSVRYGVRELQAVGLVAAKINRGGRGRSNCYTLTLSPVANDDRIPISSDRISKTNSATETLQADAGVSEAKPCKPVQVENLQTLQAGVRKPAKSGPKPCTGVQPNYEGNISRTVATTTKTDDRGPRRALEALGPPPTAGKGLGNGEPELPKQARPYAAVEAKSAPCSAIVPGCSPARGWPRPTRNPS